jgi:hypothetical protein
LDGGNILPVCLSDGYPQAGIVLNNRKLIASDWNTPHGRPSANLGGMVAYKDHIIVAYTSGYNRNNRDVALVAFKREAPFTATAKLWVTDTEANENRIKIANYGSKLLLAWGTEGEKALSFRVVDLDFSAAEQQERPQITLTQLTEPENLPAAIGPVEDITTLSNGDVAFVSAWAPEMNKLRVQRLSACE